VKRVERSPDYREEVTAVFDHEASNRDNDAVLDGPRKYDEYTDASIERHAAEWLEESDYMALDEDPETVDGCIVEPDGVCPHGYESPLLVLGIL
jgi:hypothetical protein